MSFDWVFLISLAAGFVGAMSGMGGGVVLIPALTLLGLDIKHAIAISIVSVSLTILLGTVIYRTKKRLSR